MERDLQSLFDMLNSAKLLMGYIEEKTKDDLLGDRLLQDGVIRRLTIIGEASVRVSPATQRAYELTQYSLESNPRNAQ
jgi:uncharacterized protein with HEPN domain